MKAVEVLEHGAACLHMLTADNEINAHRLGRIRLQVWLHRPMVGLGCGTGR